MQVLRGELFEGAPEAEQPPDLTKVSVVRIEHKSLRLECRVEDTTLLSEEETNLLLAIISSEGRYQTFIDRKRLAFGRQLLPGNAVFFELKGISKVLLGVVWYKGELWPALGTGFGVELIKNPGSGTCDGTYRNKRYFPCAPDSGVFVGLDKLTPREGDDDLKSQKLTKKVENTEVNLASRLEDSIRSFWEGNYEQKSFNAIKVDERVVTFIKDSPARGTVRYIGEEKDSTGNFNKIVGLELDERLGSSCGKRFGHLRFICGRGYAEFVPMKAVTPEKYFDENPKQTTGQEAQEKSERVYEEELYARSLGFRGEPSGTSKESVRKLRRTNSMTSAESEIIIAAGESSKIDPKEFIEKQRLMLREFEGKNLPDHQDNCVLIQDEEGKDSAENSHLEYGHFQSIPPDDCGQIGTSRRKTLGKQQQSQDIGSQLSSLQEKPRENDEQEKSLLERLREMEQQVTQLRVQLKGKESEEASLLREKQEQHDRLQRQLQEKYDQLVTFEAQVRKMEEQLTNVQGQLQRKHDQLENSEALVRKKEEQVTFLQRQLLKKDELLVNTGVQVRETTQQLTNVQWQLQEKDEEIAGLQSQATIFETQLMTKNQEVIELEMSLSTAQQLALSQRQRQESPDWVIIRDRIQLTNKCLGRGAWGSVVEGKYCGCAVAVKQIHDLILSPYNRRLFEREMDIASRCRHPCLLQFIGATNDEENPLFVTELMETSLRALIERRSLARQSLSATDRSVISLDVARALNYLHQKQPSPIIHRDVSSANVLLWRQGDQWRAKVSDYGTANFKQQTMTAAPGAAIYSAPEALSKDQTVMVDVYSFGVLLCEMSIQEMPDPERREQQVALVTNRLIRALIRGCLKTQPEARPTMEEIIDELEQPV